MIFLFHSNFSHPCANKDGFFLDTLYRCNFILYIMKPILEVNNVVKKYGSKTALNNVSLEIPQGCIYGLLGPNGAGKTSLLRIINQITFPDSGDVLLDGEKLNPSHVKYIGYMPEERGLYKTMKVGEQALYLAQLKGIAKNEAKKQLHYWFDKLEIGDWWDKKIHELSKGMAQKIQFVVTVLHQPKLLIFDEPFSGFDPVNANIIKDEILELKKNGSTIIFSTHRMESVEEICDEIALIHNSNKLLEGPLLEIKKQYRSNTFDLGIKTDNELQLKNVLSSKYQILKTSFKSLNQEVQLAVKLGNIPVNQLLNDIMPFGQLTYFCEQIPTVNEIFIKAVQD